METVQGGVPPYGVKETLVVNGKYKRIGYVIIPKPHCSSREGINSRCRHFDLLLFAVLAQSVAAMTAIVVVAVPASHWRSIDCDRRPPPFRPVARLFIQHTLA